MLYILVALAVGLAIGWLRGGTLAGLGERRFRLTPLLAVGIAAQVAAGAVAGGAGLALVLLSYGSLLAFAAANGRQVGFAVMAVGIVLNMVVIAANGGMPVRRSAIVAAGIVDHDRDVDDLHFGTKRHPETDDDRLTVLADIIPVPVIEEVLSFGDLVLAVGLADVVVTLMLLRRRRPRTADRPGTG